MKSMKYCLTLWLLLCTYALFAESKLAMINDPDGFTNVRSGAGMQCKVLDQFLSDDFFYFERIKNSNWVKVSAYKDRLIQGYMHNSRVQEVEKLDLEKQKDLISSILLTKRNLDLAYASNWGSTIPSVESEKAFEKVSYFYETKYMPILDALPGYFCTTEDKEVMHLFLADCLEHKGSADESPSFALGTCFICKPQMVMDQILQYKKPEDKKFLLEVLEWGLINAFYAKDPSNTNNPEFVELKARVDTERKQINP